MTLNTLKHVPVKITLVVSKNADNVSFISSMYTKISQRFTPRENQKEVFKSPTLLI